MKASNLTQLLLKYQKAKAKLVEFEINEQDYPKFRANSEDLFYFTIFIISKYSECLIDGNEADPLNIKENLELVSQYYDACFNSKDNEEYSNDFLLLGLSAYFLLNDFGSAKVLCKKINKEHFYENSPQYLIVVIVDYLLNSIEITLNTENQTLINLISNFINYFEFGNNYDTVLELAREFKAQVCSTNIILDNIFINIFIAILIVAKQQSSWEIIKKFSNLEIDKWKNYFGKKNSIKIFWESQKLIAEFGILNGKSGIVQLPTGVGKTKSLELIIQAGIISRRVKNIIVVSPLRALCNEITDDLAESLQDEIVITQFSDILQTDFDLEFLSNSNNNVIICTPEKFSYVLYHQSNVFKLIDLLIFDEAHMFDDGSRGVNFELLISEIRSKIDLETQQLVLLSAVLPNAEEIKNWLFPNKGVLATSLTLKGTPKTLGFASSSRDLHYFTDNLNEEDYFVPKSLEYVTLKKFSREKKTRVFPEPNNARDIAIYYSIKLCHNGGVAIYVNRTDLVSTALKRVIELHDRGYDLSRIINNSDYDEIQKIKNLFNAYYGEDHEFSRASQLGVFPHYSKLPNGLRISIENAFKQGSVRFVVCTSTLAQGVNIPIKYLFFTCNKTDFDNMKIRNFQNLIGRTARSGMYTSGDVIITDTKFFDKKDNHDRNYYAWERCKELFRPDLAEPCSSSILSIVDELNINFDKIIDGNYISNFIIENYNNCDDVVNMLYKDLIPKVSNDIEKNILNIKIQEIQTALQSIESYLCFVYAQNNSDDISLLSKSICENTLAFHLVDEDKRAILLKIFKEISSKISNLPYKKLNRYANSMTGITISNKIESWLMDNFNMDYDYSYDDLITLLIDCYDHIYKLKHPKELFEEITSMWINESPFYEIAAKTKLPFKDIEKICMKTLSYDMSFLVGNIVDIFDWTDDNNNYEKLTKLQKMLKFGVHSSTEILICDKIVNDRVISSKIASLVGQQNNLHKLKKQIKVNDNNIFNALSAYPSVFNEKIKQFIEE